MIVNKYEQEFQPLFSIYTIDSFLLWNIAEPLSKMISSYNYNRFLHWLKKHYEYEIINKRTEWHLRRKFDKGEEPLFSSVEIEVINRCNGECPFCPVNKKNDKRKMVKMKTELFYKIIDELGKLDYKGRLALHSNNEPFLDDRIIDFASYARKKVPHAFIYMYTNGTLLTEDRFKAIIPNLDQLIIDNYDDELVLQENARRIHLLCRRNGKLFNKVEIHVRKLNEILNTRGGQSPNNKKRKTYAGSCILPFSQIVIRPDGKTSLCCNDPYGKYTLADLNYMSLEEAWYSESYKIIRGRIRSGRKNLELCKYCDTMPDPLVY